MTEDLQKIEMCFGAIEKIVSLLGETSGVVFESFKVAGDRATIQLAVEYLSAEATMIEQLIVMLVQASLGGQVVVIR